MNLELEQKRAICKKIIKKVMSKKRRGKKKPFLKDVRYYTITICDCLIKSEYWLRDEKYIHNVIEATLDIECLLHSIPKVEHVAGSLKKSLFEILKNIKKNEVL